jgi:putative ABC transport system permease protein
LIGSFLGALLGTFIQQVLPAVLKNFLPVELTSGISWPSMAKGIGLGMIISLLFALLPLLSIRNISPLGVLRFPVERNRRLRDPLKGMLYVLIFFSITLFARQQMQSWKQGLVFTASILCAFLFLVLVAWSLRWLVRRFFPNSWNYLWRQGFANLYRPNNQTLILLTTIGLGTAFIGTLYFVHSILINRVTLSTGRNQPNMVLFDVQTSQSEAITGLAKQYEVPVLQQIPVVTMRIEQINDKTPAELKADSASAIPRRAFEAELRVSFRDSLSGSEKITAGKWEGRVHLAKELIPISIEEQYARRVHLKIGDRIIFNVQGMLIRTIIGSLRQVDWRRLQTNFRVIFPAGVLEAAPQFHVITLRVPSNEVSAHFQRAVVQKFPNVSIIDLGLVLKVLDDVLDKVGFVIRFMAGFSILTGFIVLLASVLISKYQRMQEMVLLRAMGASRRQILTITALEYFFLGALAAATGILMSLAGSWALAKYSFDASFTPEWLPVIWIFLLVSSLTILIGLLNSREVINKPPLEILRKDT